MNCRLSVTTLLFSIIVVGCATELSAPRNTSLHALAVAPNDGRADAAVNGIMIGTVAVAPGSEQIAIVWLYLK